MMFIQYLSTLTVFIAMVSSRSVYINRRTEKSEKINPPPSIDPSSLQNSISYETLGNFSHSSSMFLS